MSTLQVLLLQASLGCKLAAANHHARIWGATAACVVWIVPMPAFQVLATTRVNNCGVGALRVCIVGGSGYCDSCIVVSESQGLRGQVVQPLPYSHCYHATAAQFW